MKTRTGNLMLLMLLTLIVGAYDFQFLNAHQSMYLNDFTMILAWVFVFTNPLNEH